MASLILTTDDSSAGALQSARLADLVIPVLRRFVWGPLPSDGELSAYLGRRPKRRRSGHWLDHGSPRVAAATGRRRHGLLELCGRFDRIELWIDTRPNDQLVLIWLLDHLRNRADLTAKIMLRHVETPLFDALPEQLATWTFVGVQLTREHLDIAHLAWQAFRTSTPQAWFDLLRQDLSVLPQLRRCVQELLEELPGAATGLGASELRILELLSAGYRHPFDLFPHNRERIQRRVYDYWEIGGLLDGLALAPVPAISGLAERPFTLAMHNDGERFERYQASTLSLTSLGRAILDGEEDFSSHNPIHRWWGGTELTNANLWRWGSSLVAPDTEVPPMIECREPQRSIDLLEYA